MSGQIFSDTVHWVFIFDYGVAVGGEQYLTIGNFATYPQTNHIDCPSSFDYTYYFVDDAFVEASSAIPVNLDLGPVVQVCDDYVIDPGITENVVNNWSNGYHGST